jgi:hypothetical protein
MNNILTYNEFINEDYRDVDGCGSGGKHQDDNTTILANGGGKTIIDVIGYPTGDKQVLGTEEIPVRGNEYVDFRKKKDRKKLMTAEEWMKKKKRKKVFDTLLDLDKDKK